MADTQSSAVFRFKDIYRVPKVWGSEVWIVNNDEYCGKLLNLNKGRQCSLHYHKLKDETFQVQSGKVRLELGGEVFILLPGDSAHVARGVRHRFGGIEQSIIVEFSTHHEDSDSYRVETDWRMDPEHCK